jgi:hypothetical protein
MSSKKPSLSAALREATRPAAVEPVSNAPLATSMVTKPPGRQGLKPIGGHFDPAVSKQLRFMAIEQDSTVQDLLAEAINDLFVKHGKSPIA